MNATFGWALAVVAIAAGYVGYGWAGVALAITVVAFWLLLQFNQAMRLMRNAAQLPKGHVKSAVMMQAQLKHGMRLAELMKLTGSFGLPLPLTEGEQVSAETESFQWRDSGGDAVHVTLRQGKVAGWQLVRGAAPHAAA